MPSQFEPCGLSQMIALRYGSIPVVRETGGLKDTIKPYNMYTDEGNGFSFANYNAHELLFTVERAVKYWNDDKEMWRRMMLRGMAQRFDWGKQSREYAAPYQTLLPIKKDREDPCPCAQPPEQAAANQPKTEKQAEEQPKPEEPVAPEEPSKTKEPAKPEEPSKPLSSIKK